MDMMPIIAVVIAGIITTFLIMRTKVGIIMKSSILMVIVAAMALVICYYPGTMELAPALDNLKLL